MNAEQFGEAVRGHWAIENSLHWVLDVGFREDELRVRKEGAGDNFGVIRHICMNLLKQEQTFKRGVKGKRYRAAMDEEYRETLLFEGLF